MKTLLTAFIIAFSLFRASLVLAQDYAPDYNYTLALIASLNSQSTITHENSADTIHVIMSAFIYYGSASDQFKKAMFTVRRSRVSKEIQAAEPAEARLLSLMYATRTKVPDNLTDDDLKFWIGKDGKWVVRNAGKPMKNQSLSRKQFEALENFPPDAAASLVDSICAPWFETGPLPYGASDTTWASDSLWSIYFHARKVEFARRSIVVRLLAEEGNVTIPTNTQAVFVWSGMPSISIPLPPVTWSKKDAPKLVKLLGNSFYREAAQRKLSSLQN